jgi:hypothetical protein
MGMGLVLLHSFLGRKENPSEAIAIVAAARNRSLRKAT